MKFNLIKNFAITFTLSCLSINSFAFISAEEYLRHKETDKEGFDRIYIQGIANGFMWSNVHLKSINQKEVFCQNNLALNADNLVNILEKTLKKNPKDGKQPVEMVLLMGLIDTFPCKK